MGIVLGTVLEPKARVVRASTLDNISVGRIIVVESIEHLYVL